MTSKVTLTLQRNAPLKLYNFCIKYFSQKYFVFKIFHRSETFCSIYNVTMRRNQYPHNICWISIRCAHDGIFMNLINSLVSNKQPLNIFYTVLAKNIKLNNYYLTFWLKNWFMAFTELSFVFENFLNLCMMPIINREQIQIKEFL